MGFDSEGESASSRAAVYAIVSSGCLLARGSGVRQAEVGNGCILPRMSSAFVGRRRSRLHARMVSEGSSD